MIDFESRQKECIFTSPEGNKFVLKILDYEYTRKHIGEVKQNPSRSYGKKNSKQTYGTVNTSGDTFQDLGIAGRDIPLTVYVSGDNHDVEAKKLSSGLDEKGKSKLQLPYEGILRVQVIDYKVKVKLVENIAQSVFTINFHECGANIYPDASEEQTTTVVKDAQNKMSETASEFADTVESMNNPQGFMQRLNTKLTSLDNVFSGVQNNTYLGILKDLASGSILNNPFVAATQIGQLILLGMSSYYQAKSILNTLDSITSVFSKSTNPTYEDYIANDFLVNTAILSAAQILPQTEMETRKEAVESAKEIQDIYDRYRDYSETVEAEINKNSAAENITVSTADINETVQNCAGSLIEKADSLKIEKTIILNKNSNIINLAAEYYPEDFKEDADNAIDYLVKTNNFEGDDLLYLDKDREVIIYV